MGLGIQSHHVQVSHTPVCSGSLDFHQEVLNLVHKDMGIVCRTRSAFEVFDDSDRSLTQFIEIRVFHGCDQFLVPWSCGIELELA
jgi:hypothetical protein